MEQDEIGGAVLAAEQESKSFYDMPTARQERGKKVFVEPEVSFPIDVLECTTFFQISDSG